LDVVSTDQSPVVSSISTLIVIFIRRRYSDTDLMYRQNFFETIYQSDAVNGSS
jgi:hypothetical protein